MIVPGAAQIAPARKIPVHVEDGPSPKAIATEASTTAEGSGGASGNAGPQA